MFSWLLLLGGTHAHPSIHTNPWQSSPIAARVCAFVWAPIRGGDLASTKKKNTPGNNPGFPWTAWRGSKSDLPERLHVQRSWDGNDNDNPRHRLGIEVWRG